MSEANKSVIRRYFEEVWNNKNLALIDELAASTYVDHDPYNPDVRGPEGLRQLVTKYQTAFPDLHFTIEDLLADGDKVVARVAWKGTHKGTLEGIAPTDKPVSGTATIVSRVADQKMQEDWINWDALGLMQQIGAIPGPKQAAS